MSSALLQTQPGCSGILLKAEICSHWALKRKLGVTQRTETKRERILFGWKSSSPAFCKKGRRSLRENYVVAESQKWFVLCKREVGLQGQNRCRLPGSCFSTGWTQRNRTEVDFNTLSHTSNRSQTHTKVLNPVSLQSSLAKLLMFSLTSKIWPQGMLFSNSLCCMESRKANTDYRSHSRATG